MSTEESSDSELASPHFTTPIIRPSLNREGDARFATAVNAAHFFAGYLGLPELHNALWTDQRMHPRDRIAHAKARAEARARRLQQYKEYLIEKEKVEEQRLAAYEEFEDLASKLYFDTPHEIVGVILGWYVRKYELPQERAWQSMDEVSDKAKSMVGELRRARVDRSTGTPSPVSLMCVVWTVHEKAIAALLSNTVHIASYDHATLLTLAPASLGDRKRFIHHLTLGLHIPLRWGGADIYPRQLYTLQEDVEKLKEGLPCLRSVVVEITVPERGRGSSRGGLVGQSWAQPYTTMEGELGELVRGVRRLGVRERYLSFHELGSGKEQEEEDGRGVAADTVGAWVVELQGVVKV